MWKNCPADGGHLTDTLVSLVRQLGPRDHLRFPELARIGACIDGYADGTPPSLETFVASLGDQADQVTIAYQREDGSYQYRHFGKHLASDAGFDMTGKSTADFDTITRHHIEASFRATQQSGVALSTIMEAAPGSLVNSWQRVVFPVELDSGPHMLTMVKPLYKALDAIHARRDDVAVCVVPLRASADEHAYTLATEEPLERYLGAIDLSPIEAFVTGVEMPGETPSVGTLIATQSLELTDAEGHPMALVLDMVHGFTTPFLVVLNATSATRINDQLRSSTHLLKASFELGRLGSWINSGRQDGRFQIAQELATMMGVTIDRDGLVDLEEMRALYDDDLRDATQKAVDECWENGTSYVLEGGMTRTDGEKIQVRISGSPMRDEAGRVISLFGLVQDITAEQAARDQLRESEERFRDFAASAGDWCWETDEQHRFVDFTQSIDPASRELQAKYVGKTRLDFRVVEDDRSIIEAHFEDLEARREFSDLVYRIYSELNEDRIYTLQISGKPRFDDDGTFLGYRGTARNISDKVEVEHENRENQLALKTAQSIAKLGHWITDMNSRTTRWSDGLIALLGFHQDPAKARQDTPVNADIDPAEFQMPSWRELLSRIHRDDRIAFNACLRRAAKGERVEPLDIRYFLPGARSARHFRIMMRLREATSSHGPQLMGVAQDISTLKRAQEELEKRSATLSEAQEMGGIGDWQFELATGKVTWSRHLYTILGLDPEQFVPTPKAIYSLCGPEDCEAIRAEHGAALEGKPSSSIDVQARRGDGTFGYYTMMSKPLFDEHGAISGLFGTVQDITDRKHSEKQLRNLAFFDPLTGLANRALFSRELRDVMFGVQAKGGTAALLLLDLDHFKEVNDTLGHAAGDELLRTVARILKEHVDDRGFVARLGGDEFAVIIRNYRSYECLNHFANSIVNRLMGVLKLERGEVLTGTSLGIALIPQDGGDAEAALRNADLALYMAKDEGRGKALFFTPDMSHSVQARLNLARDLRLAIENNDLETRYQGQVHLTTGKVVGFETLVRWKHPVRGYISPAEFIPVAESSSLICDIGLWVLRDACRTGKAWLDAGEPERMISVNVSAAQIWQSDFEDDVIAIIQETGYPPRLLCLELTESVFADHGEGRVRKALARFKEAGIRLAVDDFGTGYSSLGYLNDLPFDELKIDRCFVAGVHQAPEKARLLQGIIALGRGLGMSVIGEGAEEDGEIAMLRAYGCDLVQGFAYMRPETADDALRCAEQLEFRLAEAANQLTVVGEPLKKTG
jgi:diguanylate cyclase (GGDEF)-like protein/PAS domain S-box-containing protein